MSSNIITPSSYNDNVNQIRKVYLSLLPFSMYDNPYKQYPRKVKLKQIPSNIHTLNVSVNSGSKEFMIVSSYWSDNDANSSGVNLLSSRNVIVKTRKKMKLTTENGVVDDDLDAPKQPATLNNLVDDDTVNNLIIFKPSEHDKMKQGKYSLTDLRMLCTHYGIKKSGTKPDLTQRIYTFLKQTYYITIIQRLFRKFISRKYKLFCGPGYLHTSKCVNDTDFYTFDDISKIRPLELFTYRDSDNKIYGFHIASIFHLIISSYPNITNPYNRNIIPSYVIKNVHEKLIYGSLLGFRVSVKLNEEEDSDNDAMNCVNAGIVSREKQEELFIVDLFQHINTLGNYSDSEWFITLQRGDLIRFIRNIHDIWYYRANLSQDMKERICPPNGNPFVLHNAPINLNVLTLLTDSEIRTICVSIIERMVRRGVSREDQCLGAFYVLATLTIVNQDARNALPWLYEAVL